MRRVRLLASPEYRRALAFAAVCQVFLTVMIGTLVFALVSRLERNADTLFSGIVGRIAAEPDSPADTAVSVIVRGVTPEEIRNGGELLSRYGYDSSLSPLTKPVLAGILPLVLSGLSILTLLSFALNVLILRGSMRSVLLPLRDLSDLAVGILDGKMESCRTPHSEGEMGIFIERFNQVVAQMRGRSERLGREKLFLKETLSDISHQLKTPLASLILYNDLMSAEAGMETETRIDFLEQSGAQLRRMEWLIRSLLKLAQLESGTVEYRRDPVSLSAVVEKAWFTIGPSAEKRVFTMTDGTGGSDTVSGDPDWLCEVFTNILRNAVQYTESEGSIQALLSRSPLFLRVSIRDNGPGMDDEDIPRVFERFYRGKNSTGMEHVGIGLPLAKKIIEGHGGDIRVRNTEEGGAEFIVTLPCRG